MSSIAMQGGATGTGTVTFLAPVTSTNRTLTLPDATGTVALQGGTGVGKVLQVVSTTKADVFSTTSGTFTDITGLSLSITPTSSTSKILVEVVVSVGITTGNGLFNLVRGSTNIAQSTGGTGNQTMVANQGGAYSMQTLPIIFLDSPATTSATTYKIQINASGSTMYINTRATDQYHGAISTITAMEIAA